MYILLIIVLASITSPVGSFFNSKAPLVINDSGFEFRTAAASSEVKGALAELNIKLAPEDIIVPNVESGIRPYGVIFINRAVPVELSADGETIVANTQAKTVKEFLNERQVQVGELDKIVPNESAKLSAGLKIDVIRVSKGTVTKQVKIPVKTVTEKDNNLSLGKTRVIQAGEEGSIKEEWEITYENKKEVKRKLLKKETTKEMAPQIIVEGTKVEIGKTYTGLATWYGVPGLTAASLQFPFGTKVRVINLDTNASVTVTINDRGPYGEGRIIDLSTEAFKTISSLSKGIIKVKVEEIL